jgi:hypothetical protein
MHRYDHGKANDARDRRDVTDETKIWYFCDLNHRIIDCFSHDLDTLRWGGRQAELSQILNERIRPHLQKFEQKGQEARSKRFLKAALSAVATYEHQREEQASFDRVKAREIVLAAHMAVWDARCALLSLAKDRHLSRFLERVFVHQKAKIASSETTALRQRDAKKDLARQIEESEKLLRSYRSQPQHNS